MFCHNCGGPVAAGAAFCQECGTKLYTEDTANPQSDASAVNDETMADIFDVVLTHVGANKVGVIKKVRELTGLELKESKELVDKAPVLLKKAVTQAEAEAIKAEFAKIGAVVTSKNQEGETCDPCENTSDNAPSAEDDTILDDQFNWKEFWSGLVDEIKAMSTAKKVVYALGALLAVGLLILILRLIFSSIIAVIVVGAGGYIVYHRWVAAYITERRYDGSSQTLRLPDGMSSQALMEALIGKFNYPYFKGVRYDERGTCIIEGRYSEYPVIFNRNHQASLDCKLNVEKEKRRATMLEAIAIRSYLNKFFNPSLPFDAAKDLKSLKSAEKQRKTAGVVLSVASILIVAVIALAEVFTPQFFRSCVSPVMEQVSIPSKLGNRTILATSTLHQMEFLQFQRAISSQWLTGSTA